MNIYIYIILHHITHQGRAGAEAAEQENLRGVGGGVAEALALAAANARPADALRHTASHACGSQ